MTDHSPAAAAQHPITPPPELVQQWRTEGHHQDYCSASEHAIAQSARWGADQELEACCQVLYARYDIPNCIDPKMAEDMREWLRAARRPKPPSLAEEALRDIDLIRKNWVLLGGSDGTACPSLTGQVTLAQLARLAAAAERLAQLEQQATP